MQPTVDFATPEDVPLSFELAGPGARILAALIDQFVILSLQVALAFVALAISVATDRVTEAMISDWAGELQTQGPGLVVYAIYLVAAFVVNFGYYIISEMAGNGQTLGKRVLRIRVIRDGGYSLTLTASLLRNLGRIIDMVPYTYFVGLASMFISRREKRLGDLLAGTIVVREHLSDGTGLPFGQQRFSTLRERRFHLDRQALAGLDQEHERVLGQFFSRSRLGRAEEQQVVRALSNGIAGHLPVPPALSDHRDRLLFLKEVYLALRERREMG
jgi:uncharacterized RDD family membrane protein YckC